jgi:hypothetical protein
VISDLDISKLTTGKPWDMPDPVATQVAAPMPMQAQAPRTGEMLSPAEAAAYMQEVALKLRNWQVSLEKAVTDMRRMSPPVAPNSIPETQVERPEENGDRGHAAPAPSSD